MPDLINIAADVQDQTADARDQLELLASMDDEELEAEYDLGPLRDECMEYATRLRDLIAGSYVTEINDAIQRLLQARTHREVVDAVTDATARAEGLRREVAKIAARALTSDRDDF